MELAMSKAETIQIKVKPNSQKNLLEQPSDGDIWQAKLKSPPVDGKANEELIALVAEHFGYRKSAVLIKNGKSGRMKLIQIESN